MIKNSKLSVFINDFNFPSPSWEELPAGFPNCDLANLTLSEQLLFDAIKMVWLMTNAGKIYLFKRSLRISLVTVAIIIGSLTANKIYSLKGQVTMSVNAATVSAALRNLTGTNPNTGLEKIVESTMSAILGER